MKITTQMFGKLALCALTLAVAASTFAQPTDERTAKVVRLTGNARYQISSSAPWQEAKVGDVLKTGAVIQTAAGSTVDLLLDGYLNKAGENPPVPNAISSPVGQQFPTPQFPSRPTANIIRLYENTVLAIDKLTSTGTGADQVRETKLDLRAGKIFGSTQKVKGASKYEVTLPNGVAAVRGTIYVIGADGSVSVISGAVFVTVKKSDGTTMTQQVVSGYTFDPNTGLMSKVEPALAQRMEAAAEQAGRGIYSTQTTLSLDGTTQMWVSPIVGDPSGGK